MFNLLLQCHTAGLHLHETLPYQFHMYPVKNTCISNKKKIILVGIVYTLYTSSLLKWSIMA